MPFGVGSVGTPAGRNDKYGFAGPAQLGMVGNRPNVLVLSNISNAKENTTDVLALVRNSSGGRVPVCARVRDNYSS